MNSKLLFVGESATSEMQIRFEVVLSGPTPGVALAGVADTMLKLPDAVEIRPQSLRYRSCPAPTGNVKPSVPTPSVVKSVFESNNANCSAPAMVGNTFPPVKNSVFVSSVRP